MKKIGIIGRGTASSIALLSIINRFKNSNIQIDCIHDPEINVLAVGEATSSILFTLLQNVLNFDVLKDAIHVDMTVRWGLKIFWEDNLGKDFTASYDSPACHVNAEKISEYIVKELSKKYSSIFKEYHDKVLNIKQENKKVIVIGEKLSYEYDYLIDCRGTPPKEELQSNLYSIPELYTVNSAIIYPDYKEYNENYTSAYYHKNGWMFGIPLQHRKAFGYLYNNDITSKEEATKHFKKINPEIELDKTRSISWDSYYRKEVMNNRIIYLGNKLYFFEPAGGVSLHYYANIIEIFLEFLTNEFLSEYDIPEYMNLYHKIQIEKIQDVIALNYVGNNNMDSNFWKHTSEKAKIRLKKSIRFKEWAENTLEYNYYIDYWSLPAKLMKQFIEGFNIDLKELI